jgi:hypothetical protein
MDFLSIVAKLSEAYLFIAMLFMPPKLRKNLFCWLFTAVELLDTEFWTEIFFFIC